MNSDHNTEPLIEGHENLPTGALAAPPMTPGVREAIFHRTVSVVRARSRRKRLFSMGRLSVAYAAGLITAFVALSGQPPRDDVPTAVDAGEIVPADIVQQPPVDQELHHVAFIHPAVIRRQVAGAPLDQQLLLLRTAGDRYLRELDDVEGALYCYRQLLELESITHSTAESRDESWLLARLRRARLMDQPGESNL